MIIFDLEWNSGLYDDIMLNEILQIGAVKVERPGGPIISTFSAYIRPSIHKRYAPPVRELLNVEAFESSQLDFPQALSQFLEWADGDDQFAAWGTADHMALRQNVEYRGMDAPVPEGFFDLQAAFGATAGAANAVALHHAIEYCGIPDIFGFHDAMYDAMYSAMVCQFIGERELAESFTVTGRPRTEKDGADLPRGRCWMGPFKYRHIMLNSKGCRRALCPVCGFRIRVSHWFWDQQGEYYSKVSCPHHGTYFLRLETAEDAGGLWGSTAMLPPTLENRQTFNRVKKVNSFVCMTQQKGRTGPRPSSRRNGGEKG